MTYKDESATSPGGGPPEGSKPQRSSRQDDEKLRQDAEEASSGKAPLDPADEKFLESK